MRTYFFPCFRRFFPVLSMAALLASCYSVEFRPVPDYPVLRRDTVKSVEIRYTPPERSYEVLGELVIRDFTGNIQDPQFLEFIKRECRKRGGEGAWISQARLIPTTRFRTETTSSRPGGGTHRGVSTGNLEGDVGIVQVTVFNYTEKPAE